MSLAELRPLRLEESGTIGAIVYLRFPARLLLVNTTTIEAP